MIAAVVMTGVLVAAGFAVGSAAGCLLRRWFAPAKPDSGGEDRSEAPDADATGAIAEGVALAPDPAQAPAELAPNKEEVAGHRKGPLPAEAEETPISDSPAATEKLPETAPPAASAGKRRPRPRARGDRQGQAAVDHPAAPSTEPAAVEPAGRSKILSAPPRMLKAPRGRKADDLKAIDGIGKAIEQELFRLGIFHFDQIAGWSADEAAWISNAIGFPGRVERENWIGQAAVLAGGERSKRPKRAATGKPAAAKTASSSRKRR